MSKGYLSQIEADATTRPSAETLYKIAKALGISLGELLEEDATIAAPEPAPEVSESLRQFAAEADLPETEVQMLARIRYRGRSPRTAADWRYLYESIRRSTEG